MTRALLLLLLSVACLTASLARAQAPAVGVQGLLLNTAGLPVPGPVTMVLRVWTDPTDTSPASLIYEETHAGVALVDGVYELALGAGSASIGAWSTDLFPRERFLEVVVNGEVQAPRQPLLSVAYALRADLATTALLAGNAAELGGIAPSGWQRALTGSCPAGSAIRAISATGVVTCETDDASSGDVTSITAQSALAGGGTSGAITVSVADGAISTPFIADGAVGSAAVPDDTVNQDQLAPDSVGSSEIGLFSVASSDIASATITNLAIADDAVSNAKIASATLTGADFASEALGPDKLSNESGIAFAGGALGVALSTSQTIVRAISLTAPSAGFVRVMGSLKLVDASPTSPPTWVQCGISTSTTLGFQPRGRTPVTSEGYLSATRTFAVPAGTSTIRLICIGDAGVSTTSSNLVATFHATAY
jgi:hypothetical protein